jgi:hypothetical protein
MDRYAKRKRGSPKESALQNERNGKSVCKIYYLIAGGESY